MVNGKQARRLRQLARLLQDKGVTGSKAWDAYGARDRVLQKTTRDEDGQLKVVHVPDATVWLLPTCGQAIYKQLKRRRRRGV